MANLLTAAASHLAPMLLELSLHGTSATTMLNVFTLSVLIPIQIRIASSASRSDLRDFATCCMFSWLTVSLWFGGTLVLQAR